MIYGLVFDVIEQKKVFANYDERLVNKPGYRYMSIPIDMADKILKYDNNSLSYYTTLEEKYVDTGVIVLNERQKIINGIIQHKSYNELINEGILTLEEAKREIIHKCRIRAKQDNEYIYDILSTSLISSVLVDKKIIDTSSRDTIVTTLQEEILLRQYRDNIYFEESIDYEFELEQSSILI